MILSPSQSACFSPQFVQAPRQGIPSSFSMSSIPAPSSNTSSSTTSSASATATASTPASSYEAGVEMGITPSATMLSNSSVPVQVPVQQHPSITFVPANARMVEFERLREELRRTEMVRDQQVEMLQALAIEASHELDVPQFNGPHIPTASVPIPHHIHHAASGPNPTAGIPTNSSFHFQVNPYNHNQQLHPAFVPNSMTAPMPISHPYPHQPQPQYNIHHGHQQQQQRQQVPYVPVSPNYIARGRVTKACENCKSRKVKCDGVCPCDRCAGRGLRCIFGERKVRGPTKRRKESREQVSSSSPTPPPPPLDVVPAFVATHTSFTAPLPEPLTVHAPLPAPHPTLPQARPSVSRPLPPRPPSVWSTLLAAVPSLSRSLFSPPAPAAPTLVSASGEVTSPTSTPPRIDISPPGSLPSGHSGLTIPSPTLESAVSPVKPGSPERFSDEEIQMTLEMPSDPFGTPGGVFVFLDPSQEASPFDDAYAVPDDPNQSFDFIMDFEEDLDPVDEKFKDAPRYEPTPLVEVNPLPPLVATPTTVSALAPRMPTILEEEEQEEEDGDVTITPTQAQRAMIPPDRFARPPSAPEVADASEDPWFDPLDTPRPRVQAATFPAQAPDTLDPSPSHESDPNDSQDSRDSLGQIDFPFSLPTSEAANPDFDGTFNVDEPLWNEAVFGEYSSDSSSSSSFWEVTSTEGPSTGIGMGTGVDMGLQFPSVSEDAVGHEAGVPTDDEFLRAIMRVVQSSPKAVTPGQDVFELFFEMGAFDP